MKYSRLVDNLSQPLRMPNKLMIFGVNTGIKRQLNHFNMNSVMQVSAIVMIPEQVNTVKTIITMQRKTYGIMFSYVEYVYDRVHFVSYNCAYYATASIIFT